MGKAVDEVGNVYGRLTVLSKVGGTRHGILWQCSCSCGKAHQAYGFALRRGLVQSCGCYNQEMRHSRARHGQAHTSYYKVWAAMLDRCRNPENPHYKNYGGRGIFVVERWHDFALFQQDMGPSPSKLHSLERIDNNGPYAPDNCRWATKVEQQNNMRTNRYLTKDGETLSAATWARKLGIPVNTIYGRLRRGETDSEVLRGPSR